MRLPPGTSTAAANRMSNDPTEEDPGPASPCIRRSHGRDHQRRLRSGTSAERDSGLRDTNGREDLGEATEFLAQPESRSPRSFGSWPATRSPVSCTLSPRDPVMLSERSASCALRVLWLPEMVSLHATWEYSWISRRDGPGAAVGHPGPVRADARARRRVLLQCPVRPVSAVMIDVLAEDQP
jgi:hypothetical protein